MSKFRNAFLSASIFFFLIQTGCSMTPGIYVRKDVPVQEKVAVETQAPAVSKKLAVGERLVYSIRWFGLEAGRTTRA